MLELAPQEEFVVDRHERGEVLVERRGLDAKAARYFGQAERVDAIRGHDIVGDIEDLRDGLLSAPGPPVDPSGHLLALFQVGCRLRRAHELIITRFPLDSLG